MAYTKYSLTPANNTATPPDGAPEGMLPSAVNDTMRDMMAQIRDCGDGIRDGTYTMTAAKITGGTITGITDLAIADGGTGASTAAGARTNLGLDGFVNMKNRIINGAMVIDQRNAGSAVTHSGGSNLYVLDRWVCNSTGTPQFSVQRVADAPAGFVNSSKLTTTTSGTPAAGDFSYYGQYIEGFNVADLGFGTANAKTVTISFWVKSSLTGTFGGALKNGSVNRAYPFSYVINSANTWEQKSVTITGDTTGTWTTDNTIGMIVFFDTGSGANNKGTAGAWNATSNVGVTGGVNLVATASATWNITGVQLEVGESATSFDRRPYGTELALCQRYYCKTFNTATAPAQNAGAVGAIGFISQAVQPWDAMWRFPVEMRTTPATVTTYSTNAASANWSTNTDTPTAAIGSTGSAGLTIRASTPAAAGRSYTIHASADSEL